MNRIISITTFLLVLTACGSNQQEMKKTRIMEYDCDNGFRVSFKEQTTLTEKKSSTAITVDVKSKNFNKKLEMEQVRAASGVKYATKDGKYIYWEHQGEVIFGTEDSTYCLCK